MLADLGQGLGDVLSLLLQLAPMLAQHIEKGPQLGRAVRGGVVHVHQLLDLLQAQAQALAAQGELQAGAVGMGVDAVAPGALRREQADVFIEADGARGDVELGRSSVMVKLLAAATLAAALFLPAVLGEEVMLAPLAQGAFPPRGSIRISGGRACSYG